MKNFFKELKEYLATTPKEQILAEWEKTAALDGVGPTLNEYFNALNECNYEIKSHSNVQLKNIKSSYSPKYTSGFLFTHRLIWQSI